MLVGDSGPVLHAGVIDPVLECAEVSFEIRGDGRRCSTPLDCRRTIEYFPEAASMQNRCFVTIVRGVGPGDRKRLGLQADGTRTIDGSSVLQCLQGFVTGVAQGIMECQDLVCSFDLEAML